VSNYKKNRRQSLEESHVDDWLMTYADMITLLLCFFAVFIAISFPDDEKFENAKKKVVEKFAGATEDHLKGQFNLPETTIDNPPPASAVLYDALPSIVDRYNDKKEDVQVDKRDRITTIEMNSAAFYKRGAATLSEDGIALIKDIYPTLVSEEYKGYTISVEGYTDDIPIQTAQFPSNWELSTARAAAVVRELIALGIPPQRLRAVGYADAVPKVPNSDEAGNALPDNQAQNRRVVIRLEKIEKQKTP
jgi:chemotaxis protein MotB